MRAFAPMLMTVIQEYPDTFGICAGDGEVELLSDRLNEATPYEDQIIADYSPFVILEFRDWIRNTGMYGPGGAYEGQGRAASGTRYSDPLTGLASFNADFDTSFASWDLEYFNWSLDDPVDGDPGAIPQAVFTAPGWSPLPTSGPAFIAGGFDAPRSWNEYSPEFWQLWLTFREWLVGNYVRDFTSWVMTTENGAGEKVPRSRFYTYQIPADYLWETYPGCPNPQRRLLTSASPAWTADVNEVAGVGLTVFDTYQEPGGYSAPSRACSTPDRGGTGRVLGDDRVQPLVADGRRRRDGPERAGRQIQHRVPTGRALRVLPVAARPRRQRHRQPRRLSAPSSRASATSRAPRRGRPTSPRRRTSSP